MATNKGKSDEDFRKYISAMRTNKSFCDIVLHIPGENGEEDAKFTVHRLVMASCSDFFRSLFICGLQETSQGEVKINGVNKRTMELLIQYAYSSEVSIDGENIEDLFVAADRFGFLSLLDECVRFLSSQLSSVNCIVFLRFARFFNNVALSETCWKYITRHFKEITQNSQEFVQLELSELTEIIQDDRLNVVKEDEVYEAILKWTKFCPSERNQYLRVLLEKIRFPYMSEECFERSVNQESSLQHAPCWGQIQMSHSVVKKLRSAADPEVKSMLGDWLRPRIPTKVIFVLGGWGTNGIIESTETYHRQMENWFENKECDLPTPRAYHGTVAIEDKIYVLGGFDGSRSLNSVIRYDVTNQKWEELNPMHIMRSYVSVTEIDGVIYAIGGNDGRQRHNSAETYSIVKNQWTLISPMFHRRSDASAVNQYGKLYVAGGLDSHATFLTSAECYDPTTNQWTMIAPMSTRRSGVSLAVCSDKIFAIGGYDGNQRLDSVERFDPGRGHWYRAPGMNLGRSNFSCVVMDDVIYVMGGYDGDKTSSKVECYWPEKEKWVELGDLNIGRSAVSACAVSDIDNAQDYFEFEEEKPLPTETHL